MLALCNTEQFNLQRDEIKLTHILCTLDAFTTYESFLNKIMVYYGVICVT